MNVRLVEVTACDGTTCSIEERLLLLLASLQERAIRGPKRLRLGISKPLHTLAWNRPSIGSTSVGNLTDGAPH